MTLNKNKKLVIYFIISSLLVLTSVLIVKGNNLSFALLIAIVFSLLYIVTCLIFNPLRVFLYVSIIMTMVGVNIHIDKLSGYLGGVGVSKLYIGMPHFTLFLFIITFLIYLLKFREIKINLKPNKTEVFLFIFTAFTIISALIAPFKVASLSQLNIYITLFLLFIIWSRVTQQLGYSISVRIALFALSTMVIVQLSLSIAQIINGGPLGLFLLGEGNITTRHGVSIPPITGTFSHPGPLSLFFLISMTILFPFALKSKNKILLIIFFFSLVGLILAFSRTSIIIGVLVLFVELFFIYNVKIKLSVPKIIASGIVLLIIVIIFSDDIASRFLSLFSGQDNQIFNRLSHYQIAWEYIKENPIWGYGLNNYVYILTGGLGNYQYLSDQFSIYTHPVHNVFLLFWFEGGIVLLLTFLLLVGSVLLSSLKKAKQKSTLDIGLISAIIAILLYSLTGWGLVSGSQIIYFFYIILSLSAMKLE